MPISTQLIFRKGGSELLDLLTHCVFSVNMDALFLYLVGEYQLHPKAESAVALFDVFLSSQAPARISATMMLPPKDIRLQNQITTLRDSLNPSVEENCQDDGDRDANEDTSARGAAASPVLLPPRYLFDTVVADLTSNSNEKILFLESRYDTKRTPLENLPGGKLTTGQRAFVDNVWTPSIRPYLVSSGFWRVATVG